MKSIVILISGRGSNMLEIVRRCQQEKWPARIACVISNRADAPGLQAAADLGIETAVIDHRPFESREAFDEALRARIDTYSPDVVVLAGFMRILTPGFVAHFDRRLINVHPSLLPAFTGLETHRRALEAGVKVHGATVHFVIDELDAGPIIAQAVVIVDDADTPESLMAKVQQAEHRLYPAAVKWLVNGNVLHQGHKTMLRQTDVQAVQLPT
ncbi:MAG: phosphoribosylglycinamide formyltransferase [Burkholderiaceae bacterium]